MVKLADHITVLGRFARSANLERDADRPEPFDGYVVTARALDAVERITSTAATAVSGGAWSLTGPYGSGKSSFALLLDAAFGPSTATREIAWKLIDETSSAVGDLVRQVHQRHRTQETGFHRGIVTANREPLNCTVLRALHVAVLRAYGKIPSVSRFRAAGTLKRALEDAKTIDPRRTGPSAAAMVEIARCLAEDTPLLLIIDEFGKNLEAIRDNGDADPYLLQQLAEAGQGSDLPIFVLTLQHLSFEEYLTGANGQRRQEWAKVQGRFEDITYVESARQTRALIGTVFEVSDDKLRNRIARWAQPYARKMRLLGIADLADPEVIASCYPLHPLAALVLPELCSRYGQHERTLFSFLTDPDPASAASFLAANKLPSCGPLPSLGLEAVYDYFVTNGTLAAMSSGRSSRWTEIATRLRDTHGLSKRQMRLAKIIALLNLVSTSGTIRASSQVLALVDTDVGNTLSGLETEGVITYREFADEYRIWQGTDVDIRHLLDAAHQRVQQQPLVDILSNVDQPMPVVAARHSAQYDVLRIFSVRYVDGKEHIELDDKLSAYDGKVVLVVGSERMIPNLTRSVSLAKPIVAAIPNDVANLDRVAREAAAITTVLKDPIVETDWVARRELGERLAATRTALEHAVSITFSAEACRWIMIDASGRKKLPAGRGSTALSAAADLAYPCTPIVRNEMLNRTKLTSQGAKARRLLLKAMIENGTDPNLGFNGYGPEVAMYRAFLEHTGLHKYDTRNESWVFRSPTDTSLKPAWEIIENEFKQAKTHRINLNDLYASLVLPPVGMKIAVIPVLITAALLAFNDEIAIYEHGTFKPLLTPDLSERMVRNPIHFEIKHYANTTGARRQVVSALAERLGIRPRFRKHRVANVLSIVGHLISTMRRLDNYTLHTRNLRSRTLMARDALMIAIEPDKLLFDKLPQIFGLRSVSPDKKTYDKTDSYIENIANVLDELTGCYDHLLKDLLLLLLDTSAESTRKAIVGQAAALENEVLNPTVRALILKLADDSMETDKRWIEAIATIVANKAPAEWTDENLLRFRHELPQKIAVFQRLVALHADYRADGGGPFDAFRVTITRSDGCEHNRLVGIDQNQRQDVEKALNHVLGELAVIVGSQHQAHKALLALLGERLLEERIDSNDKVLTIPPERRVQYG